MQSLRTHPRARRARPPSLVQRIPAPERVPHRRRAAALRRPSSSGSEEMKKRDVEAIEIGCGRRRAERRGASSRSSSRWKRGRRVRRDRASPEGGGRRPRSRSRATSSARRVLTDVQARRHRRAPGEQPRLLPHRGADGERAAHRGGEAGAAGAQGQAPHPADGRHHPDRRIDAGRAREHQELRRVHLRALASTCACSRC